MNTETDMVLELLSHGGKLAIDASDLPVFVAIHTEAGLRHYAGGSVAQALAQACRSLKAKEKEVVET